MKPPLFITLSLLFHILNTVVSAEKFDIYLPVVGYQTVSVEDVLSELNSSNNEEENIIITYYNVGKKLSSINLDNLDLQDLYSKSKEEEFIEPFYGDTDSYIVKDSENRYFLLEFEYKNGSRFRLAPLLPFSKESNSYVLQGFMHSSTSKISSHLSKLSESEDVLEHRQQRMSRLKESLNNIYKRNSQNKPPRVQK